MGNGPFLLDLPITAQLAVGRASRPSVAAWVSSGCRGVSPCHSVFCFPGVCVTTLWRGTSAGEMAVRDPSQEEMLCMHEGFGVTVASPGPSCRLAPSKGCKTLAPSTHSCMGWVWDQYAWWWSMSASVHVKVVVMVEEVHECLCNVPFTASVLETYCIGKQALLGQIWHNTGTEVGNSFAWSLGALRALLEPWAWGLAGSTCSSIPSLCGTVLHLGSIQLCSAGTGFPSR